MSLQRISVKQLSAKPNIWPDSVKGVQTQSQLFTERKRATLPHISYDLDGDGIVSGKEYMLSKLFDTDKDGRLNSAEKKNALDAINKGFENKFIWNIDKGGSERQIRVLQKRGVFVEAEDFQPVGKTYPKLEISNSTPLLATKEELEKSRKESLQEKLRQTKNQWDKYNPHSIKQEYILSEYLVDKPVHNSISQIKEDKLKEVRELHGLNAASLNNNNACPPNGLKFVDSPKYRTQTEMNKLKKEENVFK